MKPFFCLLQIMTVWALCAAESVQAGERGAPQARLTLTMEQKARAIEKDLRCPTCEGQSIAGSNADIARNMRRIIRKELARGKTRTEIITYLRQRYGDEILMQPPLKNTTLVLWLGPVLILGLGALAVIPLYRRTRENEGDRT